MPDALTKAQIGLLRAFVDSHNSALRVENADAFNKDLALVVVVQVHKRIDYLEWLLESVRAMDRVDEVLLVVSADFWSANLTRTVATIDFCRWTLSYFPHSIQLHPDTFPGTDPNDCARDLKKDAAMYDVDLHLSLPFCSL